MRILKNILITILILFPFCWFYNFDIGYIEKLPNDSFYNQKGYGEKLSYADDTIADMKKAYGSTLVIYTSFNDFSIHDQEIFRNMVINTKANDYRSPYNANAIQEGYINIIKVFKGLEALLGQKITI